MRARGAVALAMLGVAMACGGRTHFSGTDGVTSTGGSGSGGKTQGRGAASSGGSQVTRGGSNASAGSASTGGGPCLCLGIGCADGFVRAPDPNDCCGGECVLDCSDTACGDIDLDCRPGMHVGKLPDECCPLCVPDNPPSCEVAMKLYQEFRAQDLSSYQEFGCSERGICSLFSENNRCAVTCGTPIPGGARNFIEEDLTSFAELTCSQCPKPVPSPCPAAPPPTCVDNLCQPQPVGPQ